MERNVLVGCSGLVRANTGIGVLQRRLYPRLQAKNLILKESRTRDIGESGPPRLRGLLRGLFSGFGERDVFLSVVPPFPLFVGNRSVAIVHDLRWKETRSGASRWYRYFELMWTVRRSGRIVCISDHTMRDLVQMFPSARAKAEVAWLGPGLVDVPPKVLTSDKIKDSFLLIGSAPHKQNELAARVLTEMAASRPVRVVGVNVSDTVKSVIESDARVLSYKWYSGLSDTEMREVYTKSEAFMLLGHNEGFGLPYIEALVSGCVVIAADYELTRETLGGAALLVSGQTGHEIAAALLDRRPPSSEAVNEITSRYSWDRFADVIYRNLALLVR